jgi:putative flippase GtrA
MVKKILQHEKIRFALVGGLNTAVDFVILFSLVNLFAVPSLVANIISTSVALAVSYTLNKKAVFGNTDTHNLRQVILFVTVTLSGLWILQGAVIVIVTSSLVALGGVSLLAAKAIATLFSLTWNYLWYSQVVFKKNNNTK